MNQIVVYIDDILVTGENKEAHLANLQEVFHRLEKAGLRLKKDKCVNMVPSVTYLGHKIDEEGLHPITEKVKAINAAPPPQNVHQLYKSLLRIAKLLWEVYTKSRNKIDTTIQIAKSRSTVK